MLRRAAMLLIGIMQIYAVFYLIAYLTLEWIQ